MDLLSGALNPPAGFYGLTIRLKQIIGDGNEIIAETLRINETIVGELQEITDWSEAMQEKNYEICDPHNARIAAWKRASPAGSR